jgi:hypothetical protein
MNYYWNSEVIALLNEQGFNIQATDTIELTQVNPRHKFIHMEMVRGNSRYATDWTAKGGRRFRLYTGDFPWELRRKWEDKVRPVIIDATKPQWKRSVIRWMSLAIMTLAEAHNEQETLRAENRRMYDQRAESARQLLADTGVTVTDVASTFQFEFATDPHTDEQKVCGFGTFTLHWNDALRRKKLDEKAAHVARLLVFLQQEGWIEPRVDNPEVTSKQLLYPSSQ